MDLMIHNTGSTPLEAGREYRIERYDGGQWAEVRWPPDIFWTLEAHWISPGGSWTQHTRVPAHLIPGSFQATTTLNAVSDADADGIERITVSGAFEVVELQ
jgi:hypothetical protein